MRFVVEKPRPIVSAVNAPYFEALQEGRLTLQRCASCGEVIYYPRVLCPECLSAELEWAPVSGKGAIASFAEVHKPQHPAFRDEIPIMLIAVELAEGPIVFGRLPEGTPSSLAIGRSVEIDANATRAGDSLPFFRLA